MTCLRINSKLSFDAEQAPIANNTSRCNGILNCKLSVTKCGVMPGNNWEKFVPSDQKLTT